MDALLSRGYASSEDEGVESPASPPGKERSDGLPKLEERPEAQGNRKVVFVGRKASFDEGRRQETSRVEPLLVSREEPKTGLDFLASLPQPKQSFSRMQSPSSTSGTNRTGKPFQYEDSPGEQHLFQQPYHTASAYRMDKNSDHAVEHEPSYPRETTGVSTDPTAVKGDYLSSFIASEHKKLTKRRRGMDKNNMPTIVEVNQAELMSTPIIGRTDAELPNASEGMSTMRGGPRPEQSSKRKHQITSLYYEAKQREMSIKETKAKGMKTRKETQAKYGW